MSSSTNGTSMFGILLSCLIFRVDATELGLTSFPARAIDGDMFRMTCSLNKSYTSIDWLINRKTNFQTQTAESGCEISFFRADMYDLSSRMEANCDASQHSVNLRINTTVDRNLEWFCSNMDGSAISNSIKIDLQGGFRIVSTTSASGPNPSSERNRTGIAETDNIYTSGGSSGQVFNTCLAVWMYVVLSGGLI